MKFRIWCRDVVTKRIHSEDYHSAEVNPRQWSENVIKNYNSTLRPSENARKLCRVKILDKKHFYQHIWEKTNLVTICKRGTSYDTVKCKLCGITGKRIGIGGYVQIDSKHLKTKKAEICITE